MYQIVKLDIRSEQCCQVEVKLRFISDTSVVVNVKASMILTAKSINTFFLNNSPIQKCGFGTEIEPLEVLRVLDFSRILKAFLA